MTHLIEVIRKERQGRGRWWRANSNGYTNDIADAGLYTLGEARRATTPDHSTPCALAGLSMELRAEVDEMIARLVRLKYLLQISADTEEP